MPPAYTIDLDGKRYAIALDPKTQKPLPIRRVERVGSSQNVIRDRGQLTANDFDLYQFFRLTGPLRIGQRQGNDVTRCFDQYDILAMWPGILTRGPQKQSTTMSNFPATFTNVHFFESKVLSRLFVFGQGAAVGSEPVHRWTGSTTTFGDATINADSAIDITRIVGMAEIGNLVYAITKNTVTDGVNTRCTFQTADGSTWAATYAAASDETIITTTDADAMLFFLHADFAAATNVKLAAVYLDNDGTGGSTVRGTFRMASRDAYITVSSQWLASNIAGGADMIEDSVEPRGFELFRGPDGAADGFISTHQALWYGDRSNTSQAWSLKYSYVYPVGSYTGRIKASPDGRSLFLADGPALKRFRWTDTSGGFEVVDVLQNVTFPLDAQGDVTAMAFSIVRGNWLYFAKSGTAASRNARIYIYNVDSDPDDPEIYCFYRNSTAQRAITAMIETAYDDSVIRLFIAEEQAAGGDNDIFFFANVPFHPLENSSYACAESGTIVDSERSVDLGLSQIGWMAIQVDADTLSATKKITVRDGQDGTAPANSQDITSSTSPAQVWPDKTDASAGVGVAGKRQQIEVDILDNAANATAGPTVKQLLITYANHGHKPDGTNARVFEFVVDLMASAVYGSRRGNPKNTADDLKTTADKETLVALALPGAETIYGTVGIAETAQDPQLEAVREQASSGGTAVVRVQELMR